MLPQEAPSHTGEGDRSDKQTRTSQSTEKPGPEFPRLVQLPGTLTAAPRTCPQPLSRPAPGLDVSVSQSWGRFVDSLILTMIPSYGQLCTPPQESQGLGPKRAVPPSVTLHCVAAGGPSPSLSLLLSLSVRWQLPRLTHSKDLWGD